MTATQVDFGVNLPWWILPGVGTWERLPDPLPTTPGSVVRFGSDHLRFLSRAGWLTEYGEKVEADFPATVLFDAGATP